MNCAHRLLGCCFCFALASANAEQVALSNGAETCLVDTCGARVLSYSVGGTEVLWDMDARLSEGTPWRHGGIPLAWPWFGRLGDGDDNIHGYAWKSPFEIKSRSKDSIVLELDAEGLRLEYSIALSDGLRLAMRTTCTSPFPRPVGMAFHPYFRLGERDMAVLEGVYDEPVPCTNAVDGGVRFGEALPRKEYLLHDRARQISVRIAAMGSTGVNVWNPGAEKQCPGVIEGDEWRRFISVEPYALGVGRFMVLRTGQRHELGMTVSVLPFCMSNRDEKATVVSAVAVAGPLDELLPRPKEVRAVADGSLSEEGLPPGGYALRISKGKAEIAAVDAAGHRYAEATLDQLRRLAGGDLPDCTIRDWPTFPWRGFMHDCGRNFLDKAEILKLLDLMAAYKFNFFHWHITDYYGWRLESKKYPMLQAPWAFRRQMNRYYTQEDFKEVVAYAKARGITVMPELDVPGHTLAFRRGLGITHMSEPQVKEIVADLLDELCSLVPAEDMPFVHLGTDEARTPYEMVPDSYCPHWAETIRRNGRIPVAWTPGKPFVLLDGTRPARMVWQDGYKAEKDELIFDTVRGYFGSKDPLTFLNTAVFSKPMRYDIPKENMLGAVICSWHDDSLGEDTARIWTNCAFAPAIVAYSDYLWNGREKDRPEYLVKLPAPGTPAFAEVVAFEDAIVANRDKVIRPLGLPFAYVRQTPLRFRITDSKGVVVAKDIAQATVTISDCGRHTLNRENSYLMETQGVAYVETWIKSPRDQIVGAWIGFTMFGRSGGRGHGLPEKDEWGRSPGTKVEVNDTIVPAPAWIHPGLKHIMTHPEEPTSDNIAETPFTNEEYFMRPPTEISLKAGWNHVRLTVPKSIGDEWGYSWVSTFVPVTLERHPREVPGLEFSSEPEM